VETSNSCVRTLTFGSFFFIVFCQSFFPRPFSLFLLSALLSFLLLSNWFLFLSSFVFPLLFQHYFITISLAYVVSALAYPNLLGTKRLGCCCCCGVSACCCGCNLKNILFLAYVSPLKKYHCNLQGNTLVCIKIY
jgi:hypothetical protein